MLSYISVFNLRFEQCDVTTDVYRSLLLKIKDKLLTDEQRKFKAFMCLFTKKVK